MVAHQRQLLTTHPALLTPHCLRFLPPTPPASPSLSDDADLLNCLSPTPSAAAGDKAAVGLGPWSPSDTEEAPEGAGKRSGAPH